MWNLSVSRVGDNIALFKNGRQGIEDLKQLRVRGKVAIVGVAVRWSNERESFSGPDSTNQLFWSVRGVNRRQSLLHWKAKNPNTTLYQIRSQNLKSRVD